MTKQEFEERVLVKVTNGEYAAIEMVYMTSDLDKDEFCKFWIKMNKSRVDLAKSQKIESEENAKIRGRLFVLASTPQGKDFAKLAEAYYTKADKKILESIGISTQYTINGVPLFKSTAKVVYEIKKYLNIV